MGFDQIIGGVHQERGKIFDLGGIDYGGVTLYHALLVRFPGTAVYVLSGTKLFVPNVGASIKV